jgi:FtsP/CotA-like multicopper oxidase with cupredoxin domain
MDPSNAILIERSRTMKYRNFSYLAPMLAVMLLLAGPSGAWAESYVQCPEDTDGDGDLTNNGDIPGVQCMSLAAGDGWVTMGDGREMYIFGFADVSNIPAAEILNLGVSMANSPAPTIRTREGDKLYLSLTNVGFANRPDLFDPHSIHYHGFPNASAIFDGLPESAIAINQQASITYFYNNVEPGTYMWHCHVEATEHMQMGMLGNLYVDPIQNQTGVNGNQATKAGKEGGNGPWGYVYNDGDASTAFDKEYVIQLQAFDHNFHDASRDTQPLPFATMKDTYLTINGRGYPHTALPPGQHPPIPADSTANPPQPVGALITGSPGDRILLRLSNLGVVNHYTVTILGIPMKVVGRDARLLRGPGQGVGQNQFYVTNVLNIGGGETYDVILDTNGVAPGTYFLYSTNLNYLSNNAEDFGGYMTEIVIQ